MSNKKVDLTEILIFICVLAALSPLIGASIAGVVEAFNC